ncbi:MAG: Mur ligase domain-containing protein, partial [Candidatus Taylorbacteria bacterium]|nr:Mur ligase domain-containing protein [Candidatus Taylorbacteria bacterium]
MSEIDLSKIKTVHFIGIGGIGISAVARMFVLEGKKVSGSDRDESEVTRGLREIGVTVSIGEDAGNIPVEAELVIHTRSIGEDNAELVEAKKRGIPVLTYPEALGIISKDKYTIAITGTHGKTTTTAMVAKILIDSGLDPTVVVGSLITGPDGRKTNFISGKSKYFVVEGCEYKRSFLSLNPHMLVVTNIEADHLDYYKDIEDIKNAFQELSAKLPSDGFLLINAHSPNGDFLVTQSRAQNGDWGALHLPEGFTLRVPGKHNKQNARAAFSVAKALGISEEKALASLSDFTGTWRRFE